MNNIRMELTAEQLEQEENSLKQEIITFAQTAQAEVTAIQQALQNKVRESQKRVDNLEGRLTYIQELRAKGSPKTDPVMDGVETGKEPKPSNPDAGKVLQGPTPAQPKP